MRHATRLRLFVGSSNASWLLKNSARLKKVSGTLAAIE
jgi:hypothetical protein